ncbi:MAG: glycosyltransferase [Phycisphaerales bacterium]|jgi:GT2 family glycosyltransferase
MTAVSYVTCTRNRPAELAATLRTLDALHRHASSPVEVVIADNASDVPVRDTLPETSLPVRVVRLDRNMAASARNHAAAQAEHDWLIMLDDDSAPLDLGHLHVLERTADDVAAVMADITLPDGSRERGGLPEVLVGCGAAVRRQAYLDAGGYDEGFFFAAEEPDLCARLIDAGWRLVFSPWFRVLHHKTSTNRDLNRMIRLLTRNQGVIIERTTPARDRAFLRRDHVRRCAWIADKENAVEGFRQGLAELRTIRHTLERRPMSEHHFERFVGLYHAREAVDQALATDRFETARLVHEGKHAWAVRRAITEAGVEIVDETRDAERLVIGTLSPGPMLDALAEMHGRGLGARTLAPWVEAPRILGIEADAFPLMPGLEPAAVTPRDAAATPARARIRA